jgi:outer membrane autotransporter protein
MFLYQPFYDAELKQFKIVAVPSAGAFHQTLIANAAQSAWRTANGSFFDRQADLRDSLRRDQIDDHGVWIRVAHDAAEREVQQTFSIPSGDIVYDNTHDIDTDSVTLGVDFVRGGGNASHWVAGGMVGYVRTDMAYARFWTDTARMNGMMAGFYGSYVNGPLFVDAAVSGNWTRLVQDMPQAELFRGRPLSSEVETLGAQVEAGWRFDLGVAQVEPLVNAAWSQTEMDDFKVPEDDPARPGNQIMFDKTTSQRVGLGLRGSREFTLQNDVRLGVSLTGRVQEELDGEATAKIGNLNPISPEVRDEFDGSFSELIGGLTLTNRTGRVSGALNVGGKFGDDYEALSGSVSFRYQW